MPYPRLLKLDKDTSERLRSWIYDEMIRHMHERVQGVNEVKQWQTEYWAKPADTVATFPFRGASRVIVPLEAISVEATHAKAITQLFGVSPFISTKVRNADLQEFAPALDEYLDFELMHNIKAYNPTNDIVLETEKFGTGIGKSGYERVVKKAVIDLPDGSREDLVVIQKDGATLDAVPNANFLMPYAYLDPQTAPWCGENHSWSPFEILTAEQSGLFYKDTFEAIKNWVQQTNVIGQYKEREYTRHMEELEQRKSFWPRVVDFQELWCSFDVDKDGQNEELQVFWHFPTGYLMGARYNWYPDLHRPYRISNYMRVEHRWRGIGICKQLQQFQLSVTTQHRQRLDNATLANVRMYKIHKLSGYGPKEPIFPGKMWFLDDMSHVEAVQMGDVYQSSFANEQATLLYAQQRSGITELTLGMQNAGTPGTATDILSRLQEGNKKFDYYMMNIKKSLAELYTDVLLNIKAFGSKTVGYYDYAYDGDKIKQLLAMPDDVLRHSLLFEIGLAGQQHNRVMDRQNWMMNAQSLQQYYTAMVQLAQLTGDKSMMAIIARKAMYAATEAMKQILEASDVHNVDHLVLIELLRGNIDVNPDPRAIEAATSGNQVPGGNGGQPGNSFINSLLEAARTNSSTRVGGVPRF